MSNQQLPEICYIEERRDPTRPYVLRDVFGNFLEEILPENLEFEISRLQIDGFLCINLRDSKGRIFRLLINNPDLKNLFFRQRQRGLSA